MKYFVKIWLVLVAILDFRSTKNLCR